MSLTTLKRTALFLWPVMPPALLTILVTTIAGQGDEYTRSILMLGLINLLFVIGLYCFAGTSGVFSFGHIAFAAIGAYAAGIFAIPSETKLQLFSSMPLGLVNLHQGALVSTLIGGCVAMLAGVITSIPLMRLGGLAASLATFALLIIVHVIGQNLNEVTNGQSGIAGVPLTTTVPRVLVWCLIAMVAVFLFQESRWGLRLRASREDEVAARASGIGVYTERRTAWILSSFIVGIGGALYGQLLGTFNADAFYFTITFMILAMLVVGGRTSLAGAVIGSGFISIVAEVMRRVESGTDIGPLHIPSRPGLEAVGLGTIMVLILVLRPRGITGGREITWPFTRAIRRSIERTEDAALARAAAAAAPSQDSH